MANCLTYIIIIKAYFFFKEMMHPHFQEPTYVNKIPEKSCIRRAYI